MSKNIESGFSIKNISYGFLVFCLVFGLSGGVSAACDIYCDSCDTCTAEINAASAGETICLNQSIYNHSGTCINNPSGFNNKVFDCQENTIAGDDIGVYPLGVEQFHGIYLSNKINNTIKNCIVSDFVYGISLGSSSDSTLTNNIISSNYYGVYIHLSQLNPILTSNFNNISDNNPLHARFPFGFLRIMFVRASNY